MKGKIWVYQIPIVVFFTVALLIYEAGVRGQLNQPFLRERTFKSLQNVNGWFTNLKFKVRGPRPPKNKVVIVEVDSDAIASLGRWPWHRDVTAFLIESIFAAGAKSVGLDMVFSEEDRRVSDEVATVFKKHGIANQIQTLETDPQMTAEIAAHKDRLCLGWLNEADCQPVYQGPKECPVKDTQYIAELPKNFQKFSVSQFETSSGFDPEKTAIISAPTVIANLPEFNDAGAHSGYLQVWPDDDGYIRRMGLVMMVNGRPYPSLALEMARMALGEELRVRMNGQSRIDSIEFAHSGRKIPVTPIGAMEMNFRGPSDSFQYVRALEVIHPEDTIRIQKGRNIASASKKEILKDAYVFVGLTAKGVYDIRAFPFDSNTPGVEGQATILDNLLANDMLTRGHGFTSPYWLFFLTTIGAVLFAFYAEKLESVPGLLLFLAVMSGVSFVDFKLLFSNQNINWGTGPLYIELMFLFASTLAVKYVREEQNKKFIRGAFAKYVAPAVVDNILKEPGKLSVGGERRELTILFSDIRGFTSFSEYMEPKVLTQFLNDYLGIMTDIVFDNGGTLDKYIGDAVMAFWGAPLDQTAHSVNASKASVLMIEALRKNHARFKSQYGVDVKVGIGLNSGQVSVGNMGSDRVFEYTVIGDHVNLASRLEGLTKTYGAEIITSRYTFEEIQRSGAPLPRHRVLDFVKVKGKKAIVEIIQILTEDWPKEGLNQYAAGLEHYKKCQWQDAIHAFESANQVSKSQLGIEDQPALLFVERCREFMTTPPAKDWDGSWEMHNK